MSKEQDCLAQIHGLNQQVLYTEELFGLFSDKLHTHTQIFVIVAAVASLPLSFHLCSSRHHSFKGEKIRVSTVKHPTNTVTHVLLLLLSYVVELSP